jgi:hypothetical protein
VGLSVDSISDAVTLQPIMTASRRKV